MRIVDLDILAYGPFSAAHLDLSGGEAGLHLVYGPNEAGKSSALRTIHALLFGIPQRTDDDFLHPYKELRIGARIRNRAGQELTFVRKKGLANTILESGQSGKAYGDDVLAPFLGGTDGATFDRIYGIDHLELLRGGRTMKELRGLVGESLFAVGLGGVTMRDVLAELDREACLLYRPRGKSSIGGALRDYRDTVRSKREAQVPALRWQERRGELAAVASRRDSKKQTLAERRAQRARCDRIQRSLELVREREELADRLALFGEAPSLPAAYDAEERRNCMRMLAEERASAATLGRQLDGDGGTRARISAIAIPANILEQGELITALHERLGTHLKSARQVGQWRALAELASSQASNLLKELDPNRSAGAVDQLRLAPESRRRIHDLAAAEQRLRERPAELARRAAELDSEFAHDQAELEALPTLRNTTALTRALARVQRHGDLEERRRQLASAIDGIRLGAEQALAALGLWRGELAQIPTLPLPGRATVERIRDELANLDRDRERIDAREGELRERVASAARRIVALEAGGDLADEDELAAAREQRDQHWRELRLQLDQGAVAGSAREPARPLARELADDYEAQVARVDELADGLRTEADRVAELGQAHNHHTAAVAELAALAAQRRDLDQRRCQVDSEWAEKWRPAAIDPLPPREMESWLRRHHELVRLVAELSRRGSEAALLDGQISELAQLLDRELDALGQPQPPGQSLAILTDRATDLVAAAEANAERRRQIESDMRRLAKLSDQTRDEHQRATLALSAWSRDWAAAVAAIGSDTSITATAVSARLARLDELFASLDRGAELSRQIAELEGEAARFTDDARALAARVATDLVDQPAEQIAAELNVRLLDSRASAATLRELEQRQAELTLALSTTAARSAGLERRLGTMCELAGVADPDHLDEIERRAAARGDHQRRLSAIDDRLHAIADGLSVDELRAAARGQDPDELAAQIAAIDDEIIELERQRGALDQRIGELNTELAAIDGGAAAAEADEKAIGILSRIHDQSGRYLRLRLAAAFLRGQIEQHRAAHQDPLLARASTLFARLTCGAFTGLGTDFDDDDRPIVVGLREADASALRVEHMSDGTRDQLYLSLRLAYLEKHIETHEPLPFIVDDILINFDDERAAATFAVLAELSARTQVIFFTHHEHLTELLSKNLAADAYFVHRMPAHNR